MKGRCSGKCCEIFSLPYSPEDVEKQTPPLVDGEIIKDMVIAIGPDPNLVGVYLYTCRHYKALNCSIYETRPDMCRGYPYGSRCGNPGCTLDQSEIGSELQVWSCSKYMSDGVVLVTP